MTAVVWFRDDLRLSDHPALTAASRDGRPILALYVLDESPDGPRPPGAAARWWLDRSLAALAQQLARHGLPLILRRGRARDIVPTVARAAGASQVHWNRRYEQAARDSDAAIKTDLAAAGIAAHSHHGNLLFEPWTVMTGSGTPYRVFTPFWRACRGRTAPRAPLPRPQRMVGTDTPVNSDRLSDWWLYDGRPDWAEGIRACWQPGEAGAAARLAGFLDDALAGYADRRDRPDLPGTSRLSPHLRSGEISPFQVWHAVEAALHRHGPALARDAEKFLAELGWREFCWHLLFHRPDLAKTNVNTAFDAFPWRRDAASLTAWRKGRTGIPIVDAGLRELWRTGFMHNRVRMIAASFLTKHLMQDWRAGEAWFWDTLVDADAANNPAGWQWVAGSGADAAPFFRIFNPVRQGETFDPDGVYIAAHLPELAGEPAARRHLPGAGGRPVIVDLADGRRRALAAYAAAGR